MRQRRGLVLPDQQAPGRRGERGEGQGHAGVCAGAGADDRVPVLDGRRQRQGVVAGAQPPRAVGAGDRGPGGVEQVDGAGTGEVKRIERGRQPGSGRIDLGCGDGEDLSPPVAERDQQVEPPLGVAAGEVRHAGPSGGQRGLDVARVRAARGRALRFAPQHDAAGRDEHDAFGQPRAQVDVSKGGRVGQSSRRRREAGHGRDALQDFHVGLQQEVHVLADGARNLEALGRPAGLHPVEPDPGRPAEDRERGEDAGADEQHDARLDAAAAQGAADGDGRHDWLRSRLAAISSSSSTGPW